jgi:hypothetical protein
MQQTAASIQTTQEQKMKINRLFSIVVAMSVAAQSIQPLPAIASEGDWRVCGHTWTETICGAWMSYDEAAAIVEAGDGGLWIEKRD